MEKKNRLTKREYFDKVYRGGKSVANHQFVLYSYARPQPGFRLGISVSKKLGNAVVRNYIKRRVKEIVRLNSQRFPAGYDYILIARKPVVGMAYAEIEKSIFHVLKRSATAVRK